MLQITPQMKILMAFEPSDFRRGIDALARLCQESLQHDAFVGAVFVFRNRNATALKVLMYDGKGLWFCHKRLSQGRFPWWPSVAEGGAQRLAAHQMSVLLSAGNPTRRPTGDRWVRRLDPALSQLPCLLRFPVKSAGGAAVQAISLDFPRF